MATEDVKGPPEDVFMRLLLVLDCVTALLFMSLNWFERTGEVDEGEEVWEPGPNSSSHVNFLTLRGIEPWGHLTTLTREPTDPPFVLLEAVTQEGGGGGLDES